MWSVGVNTVSILTLHINVGLQPILDRIGWCWWKYRRMVVGSFILARKQKPHRFLVDSLKIQFTVHIEQWQRSKKKIHVRVRFRFFQCKWTLTQHWLGAESNAQYKRTLAMCFKIQLCSCYKIQTKARLLNNTHCISESSIKCMQFLNLLFKNDAQWLIQDFQEGAPTAEVAVLNNYLENFGLKTAWKWKKLGRGGGTLAPPWIRHWYRTKSLPLKIM